MKKKTEYILNIAFLIIIILWTIFVLIVGPSKFISSIGIHNVYLILFVSSFLGGFTTVSAVTVYPSMIALTFGGLNPFIVGAVTGIALSFANLVFYNFGMKGRTIVEASTNKFSMFARRVVRWINQMPDIMLPILIGAYVALTPLPNNLLMVSAGLFRIKLRNIILPLFIGNIIAMILIIFIAKYFQTF